MPALRAIEMPEASAYHMLMLRETPELYGDVTRTRLEAGALISAVDYVQAQRVRSVFKRELRKLFDRIDVLLTPTVPVAADLTAAESTTWPDGTEERLAVAYIRFTVFADLAGLPALDLPCGFTRDGLPIGLQLMGRPFDEQAVLRAGAAYEAATDWHYRHPCVA